MLLIQLFQLVNFEGTVLKNAGYHTAAIGKAAPLLSPLDQGFDYFVGQIDQGLCHNM